MLYLSSPRSITSIIPAVHVQAAGKDLEKSQVKIYLLRYNQELVLVVILIVLLELRIKNLSHASKLKDNLGNEN